MILVQLAKLIFSLLLYAALFFILAHFLLINFSEEYRKRDECLDLGSQWSNEKNDCEAEEK